MADELTLTVLVDAIVEIVDDAVKRGEELTGEDIEAAVLARHPSAPPALLQLAFPQAARRLRIQAERAFAEADALRLHREQRRAAGPGSGR